MRKTTCFICLFLLLLTSATAFGEEQMQSAPSRSGDREPAEEQQAATPAAPSATQQPAAIKSTNAQKIAPARAAANETSGTRDTARRTWEFLKDAGKDSREEMIDATLLQLSEFLRLNPEWEHADEAQLLKADLHVRRGDYKSAAVDVIKLMYEYPDTGVSLQAKRILSEMAEKKLDKKVKPVLYEAGKGSGAKEKSERLAQMLKKLAAQTGDTLYEPLVAEFNSFFTRFPSYAGMDELNLLLGDLHVKKEKYMAALSYYRKVLALYPESALRPRAQRSIADCYVNNLKNFNDGMNAYQEVIAQYPASDEAAYSYEQMAKVEEQLKHFDLAAEINEKIAAVYPNKDAAIRAFNNEARILRDRLERPDEAIRVYNKLADMFKGSASAVEALKAAAAVAHRQKKYDTEVAQYLRIVSDSPTNKEAPEMLYQAAQVTEEDLAKIDPAIELYKQLTEKYPSSKQAQKAKDRIASLSRRKS